MTYLLMGKVKPRHTKPEPNPEPPPPEPVPEPPTPTPEPSPPPPGTSADIVGYGRATTGGAGGTTISVSNWAEFRSAFLRTDPRIIVLTANIDGTGERLTSNAGNMTINGNGHWIKDYSLVLKHSNAIFHYIKLWSGDNIDDTNEGDCLTINPGSDTGDRLSNVVVDHCSLLFGLDVTLGILNQVENMTVQYSIMGAGLYQSARTPGNPDDPTHGYGPNITTTGAQRTNGTTQYARRTTMYRNFITTNDARNLRGFGNDTADWVNNAFYNWGKDCGHANFRGGNIVGNMFRKGPESHTGNEVYYTQLKDWYPTAFLNSVYWADNIGIGFTPTMDFKGAQRTTQYAGGLYAVTAAAASPTLFEQVIADAGTSSVSSVENTLRNHALNGTSDGFYDGPGFGSPNPSWP